MAETEFTGDFDAAGLGLYALKLNPLIGLVTLDPVQSFKEIHMPPGAAELSVRDNL